MLEAVNKQEEVDLSLPFLLKFNNGTLSQDGFKDALRLKFFRLCTMYFIKNKDGEKVRFRPNFAQTQYYAGSHQNDIILKARQLGFTTFKMIESLDSCLFSKNFSSGCIAHNDKDSKDIYRSKIRFAYRSIKPSFIKMLEQIGFSLPVPVNDKDNAYVFSNGSSIGVSTGYRGGTLQSLHISEFGKIAKKYPDKAKEIVTGAFNSVGKNCTKTIESTAEGKQGYFYDYCREAKKMGESGDYLASLQFKFHFFAWWSDPEYFIDEPVEIPSRLEDYFRKLSEMFDISLTEGQKRWYVLTEKLQGDEMKREYPSTPEEAFEQAVEGAYYAKQFAAIYKDGRIGDMPKNSAPVHTAWDLGVGDSTAIWFFQEIGDKYHIIDYYENSGEGMRHYFKVLKDRGYSYGDHYAPHDISHREFGSDAKTRMEIAQAGFDIDGENYSLSFIKLDIMSIDEGIELAREALPKCCFDSVKTEDGVKCLESYRKEWNDKLGCWRDRPLHDWASHGADAFRYLSMAISIRRPISRIPFRQRL